MTRVFLTIDWQTLADALALGGIYALMAIGIGLVFGVLRLVNFAYGQLVMAGAFALALGSQWGWPTWLSIVLCFVVVLILSMLMDRLVFRPLRTQRPEVMLIATFAVAFLLQSVALIWFGALGKTALSLAFLNQPWTISGVDVRKISIVAIVVTVVCLGLLQLLLTRTSVGLHMRAASQDFETARLLGVRANRVIGGAVLISGALAAVVAVMLTVQNPTVTPDFALDDTIVVLAGVVLGGLNPPDPGDARRLLDRVRLRAARRRPADGAEPVSAVVHLRSRDPRPPRAAGWALRPTRNGGAAVTRASVAGRPVPAHRCNRVAGQRGLERDGRVLHHRSRERARSSSRCTCSSATPASSRSATSASWRSACGRPECSRCRAARSRRSCRASSGSCERTTVGNVPSLVLAALVGGIAAGRRRVAVDAAVGPRRRHRDVRGARDHAQPPALLREDRARLEHVLVRARDDRHLAGGDRGVAGDRRRVPLRAQPVRPDAARNPRGSGGSRGGRRVDVPATPRRLRAVRRDRRVRRRASTSTCCR